MYPDADALQDDAATSGEPLRQAALFGYAALVGTVDATVEAAERNYYDRGSEMLIRGAPLASGHLPANPPKPQFRAKDLIAELNIINSQIHQIIFQVEKAVAQLTTND
jgi:hypothetical protein